MDQSTYVVDPGNFKIVVDSKKMRDKGDFNALQDRATSVGIFSWMVSCPFKIDWTERNGSVYSLY